MNLIENIREGLKSVQSNLLRSVLTALIVALGITSLVGVLTAVDSTQQALTENLSSLGLNTFDITSKRNRGTNRSGIEEKKYSRISYREARRFLTLYHVPASISLSATIAYTAEAKYGSEKTNPNVFIKAINGEYMGINALEFATGRNFSALEMSQGSLVAIIGSKVKDALFKKKEDPINTNIFIKGIRLRVVGVLKEKGNFSDENYDNMVFVPILLGNQLAEGDTPQYTIKISAEGAGMLDYAMGEATGLMRSIRRDAIGEDNSFEIRKSESLAENVEKVSGILYISGFVIGLVTLIGASIALMNIMLVSVTERTREIGIRKALGATPRRIKEQFVIEAIVVCLLGGLLGVILGIGVGNGTAFLLGVKSFVIPWGWIFIGLMMCIIVGLVSGIYPARKAAKLDPIESLRFE